MTRLALALLLLPAVALAQTPRPPVRDVPDPGVIATMQRVTPAGVQSAFTGRVGGVRFGSSPDEVWVAVPGWLYRLDWRSNKAIATARVDGRPGVFGVARDPLTNAMYVSSVGRLAPSGAQRQLPNGSWVAGSAAVAHLDVFDGTAMRDSVARTATSPALGDYMAGAPAVARRALGAAGRVAVVPLPANDALAVLDAKTAAIVRMVPLGVEPIAAAITDDGSTAFVSLLGGAKPVARDRSATECCDPRAEVVRVDARGIASPGAVARVDVASGQVKAMITVGRHPTALAFDPAHDRLYVADGNSDSISVVDTKRNVRSFTIPISPFRERKMGLAPTALALAPNGATLFVALGGANAVAVFDVSAGQTAKLRGLIPTSWYPASLDVSDDGKYLAIGSLLGIGSGSRPGPNGKVAGYALAARGAVNVVEIPSAAALAAYTTAVSQNDHLTLASGSAQAPSVEPRAAQPTRAVPERPGEPSAIEHVVFIVRENRTYDQVLGDLGRGNGDPSLVMYGRDVTPNAHALSEQFVTLDHFFASGGNSADGHQWLTQANETEYPMWPLYFGRSYPSEGNDPLAYSASGFLWESAQQKGKRVTIFGEYAPAPKTSRAAVRDSLFKEYNEMPGDAKRHRELLARRYDTHSEIPSLDKVLVREYPGWTEEVPDVMKAGDILAHLADWEKAGQMPDLTMVILPNDHTVGTSAGWCAPKACVADNDLALGKIVEGLSHSQFWKDMAILVVEDDAQDGVDHVDGHRTVALAISPYSRRGSVDSTFYSQPSMVKTVELMLGLPALSLFDLVATDMRASFIGPAEKPNAAPYTAIVPKQSLAERNVRVGEIKGAFSDERKRAARASAKMDFTEPDEAPTEILNRILWNDAKGWGVKYPGVKRSLFFPLAVEVDDADRKPGRER